MRPTVGSLTLALTALVAVAGAGPARSQETPAAVVEATLGLAGQPLWHGAEDSLGFRLRIANEGTTPLGGFRLSIAAYDRVSTRFGLQESLDIDPALQFAPSSYSRDYGIEVSPQETAVVRVDDPIGTLDTLARATESGVYPITISLLDAPGTAVLARVTTLLIFYPEDTEVRLNIVTVVPLNDLASRDPAGIFSASSDSGGNPLEEALAGKGWLTSMLTVLGSRAGPRLHLGLAPTPRLIDELADMADGYERALSSGVTETVGPSSERASLAREAIDSVTTLLHTRGVQPILVPYSFADLPTLARIEFEQLAEELTVAEKTLAVLDAGFTRRWLLAPGGRLDETTLGRLKDTVAQTAARTVFAETSLQQPTDPSVAGCPSASPSFSCPVVVETVEGRTVGYQSDAVLQDRLAALAEVGDDRLDLQRFLAETAMIREELPGLPGRVVQVTLPSMFHIDPRLSHLLFKGISRAPWLRTLTPNQGLHLGIEPAVKEFAEVPRPVPNEPDDSFFDAIETAREVIESFALIGPPDALLDRLKRDLLVAYSRNWWSDPELVERGLSYAMEAEREAQDHLNKVTVLGAPEITMTSRRGEIQLLLSNENDFPVTVAVRLTAPQLELANDGVVTKEFPANKTTPVVLEATAQGSGIFPVEVRVETAADGRLIYGPTSISVRSTELNRIAVGITLGALAFLVLFYLSRSMRVRRRPGQEEVEA